MFCAKSAENFLNFLRKIMSTVFGALELGGLVEIANFGTFIGECAKMLTQHEP